MRLQAGCPFTLELEVQVQNDAIALLNAAGHYFVWKAEGGENCMLLLATCALRQEELCQQGKCLRYEVDYTILSY